MPKYIFNKVIALLILLSVVSLPVFANKDNNKLDILSIHSYHQDYPWTLLQYNSFKQQLTKELPNYKLNFLTEYLDTKHIPPSEVYQKNFFQYISTKYDNHLPDIIYVTDDNALNFMTAENMVFTQDIPIFYSGINNTELDTSLSKHQLMGVFEYKDIHSSIELAKQIQPDLSSVIFLGDMGSTDTSINHSLTEHAEHHKVKLIHLSHNKIETLISQLNSIDSPIIILTSIGGIHSGQDHLMSLEDIITSIAQTGKIILAMEDSYLLPGVLGGYITTGQIQGASTAKIVSQYITNNKEANQTQTVQNKTSELILSWPELQNFNIILPKELLNQASIINQPATIKNDSPFLLKSLMAFVILLLVILFASMFNTRRKSLLLREQYIDKLTGLPNRIKLIHDISKAACPSLIILDIKNFKSINNLYGLEVGDEVLINFAQKAKNYIDNKHSLYRIYGNQFAILNYNCDSPQEVNTYIYNLLDNIEKYHYHIEQVDIKLTLTAGISRNEHEFLIPMAEQALQNAKRMNKDFVICDTREENTDQQQKNLIWSQKLSSALADDRVVPYFQLITHNKTGKKDKFEALVRLIDDTGEVISPFFFLDAAKATRQYATLTKVMIEKTFQSIQEQALSVSINFTVNDIRDEATIAFFITKLNEYNVADKIIVELTESEGIENYNEVTKFIKVIKEMGCRVAIDDFGTGYSNFTHLIHLNVDYLKIDGSIIQNIIQDKNAEIVAKTLVEFSQQLGIETIAEFVDSQEILDKVTELGIDYSQGYFLGKPKNQLLVESNNEN